MGKKVEKNGNERFNIFDKPENAAGRAAAGFLRSPIHVVYGGADRFTSTTTRKLGTLALAALRKYASNFVEFGQAMLLPGSETLPHYPEAISTLEKHIARSPNKVRTENFDAWFSWMIYKKTIAKLETEPIEDFRIDFEDGYGFRIDEEEDRDAVRTAGELAVGLHKNLITPFSGFRIKSFSRGSYDRSLRTLNLFLDSLFDRVGVNFPPNFVVTLPKINSSKEVAELADRLRKFEKKRKIPSGTIGIELMIETPRSIFDKKGRSALVSFVKAASGRCRSVHFGAYDFTSSLGIVSKDQGLHHPACQFARQAMLTNLAPLGIRLSDSVTIKLPVPIHKHGRLKKVQALENRHSVLDGWREHSLNISGQIRNGFYQSWDLHPNQLPARYAAVYSYFLESSDEMAKRLTDFVAGSTKAIVTGNTFDDAASAEGILNFFRRGRSCGAFDDKDIKSLIRMSSEELRTMTFEQLANTPSLARRSLGST